MNVAIKYANESFLRFAFYYTDDENNALMYALMDHPNAEKVFLHE